MAIKPNHVKEKKMTTLITGAGLIGTSYAQHAIQEGEKVIFLDPIPHKDYVRNQLGGAEFVYENEDVRSLPGLIKIIQSHAVDRVLHTASVIGQKAADPIHFGYGLNIGGTMALADAVRLTGVKKVVHISTFGAYDWRKISEGPVQEDNPLGSGAAYSNSKVAQEKILEAYSINAGFELIMLRLANTFGVGHFWGGSGGGQKVQDLVMAGITGEPARIPEEQTMDFAYIYSKDVGRAINLAMKKDTIPENVFNIGYEKVHSFDDLVKGIKGHMPNLSVEIIPGTRPKNRALPLDCSRARNVLGWEPEYNFEDAIADYANDLRNRMG